MKVISLIFTVLINTQSLTQIQDKKAYEVFSQNMFVIKQRLDKKQSQDIFTVYKSIKFLESITKIHSHSDGDYFGRYNPTTDDYKAWAEWFEKNKTRLYWDEKQDSVKVKPAY